MLKKDRSVLLFIQYAVPFTFKPQDPAVTIELQAIHWE